MVQMFMLKNGKAAQPEFVAPRFANNQSYANKPCESLLHNHIVVNLHCLPLRMLDLACCRLSL